jgi:serine protease Do
VIRIDASTAGRSDGNSDAMEIGDWVLAIGSPFGLDATVTAGIISAKGRGPGITAREDFLQTDAAINPGNSGGPLINLRGEVIGINTAISTRSGGYDGIGFAIPINMAKWVANQLVEKGEVSRAFLGVGIQPVDNSLAKKLKVSVGEGALVNHVMPKSPAAAAKIEIEDLILELNGQKVKGARELQGIVEQLELGKDYPMVVLRNGEKVTLTVKAEAMPQNYTRIDAREEEQHEEGTTKEESTFDELGLDVKLLTPEMAKRLDIPSSSKGLVITGMKEESAGERAGLRPGYVIERVGKTPVTTVDEYRAALKEQSLKEGVSLLVNGGGGTRFIVIQENSPASK